MPPNSAVSSKPPYHVSHGRAKRKVRLLPPPVGTSDWARFSRTSYCVDKTLILKFGMAFYKKNLVVCRDLP